jgi:hypothetical protein
MWELLITLGCRTRPLLLAAFRATFRAAIRSVTTTSAVAACARGAVGVCSRHPRWSGAVLGVAVVAAGWGMLSDSTAEPAPSEAAKLTGLDGELIPVLPDVADPPAAALGEGRRMAAPPLMSVSLPDRGDAALPLLPSGQPVLYQPPLYRPASVASYRHEEHDESKAVWLMGTIEASEPSPVRTAARPDNVHTPPLWPRH